jgi:hypothetical protein
MPIFIAIFAGWLILLTNVVGFLPSKDWGEPGISRDDPELELGFVKRLESDYGLRFEGEYTTEHISYWRIYSAPFVPDSTFAVDLIVSNVAGLIFDESFSEKVFRVPLSIETPSSGPHNPRGKGDKLCNLKDLEIRDETLRGLVCGLFAAPTPVQHRFSDALTFRQLSVITFEDEGFIWIRETDCYVQC